MYHHFLCHKNVYHIVIVKPLLSYLNLYYIQKIMEQFSPYLLEISEQSLTNVLLLTRNWMHHGTQGTFVYSRGDPRGHPGGGALLHMGRRSLWPIPRGHNLYNFQKK
jgi:hypothetical protein